MMLICFFLPQREEKPPDAHFAFTGVFASSIECAIAVVCQHGLIVPHFDEA
jgi:hypothetical protein